MESINLGRVVCFLNSSCGIPARTRNHSQTRKPPHLPSNAFCWKRRLTFGKALHLSAIYHLLNLWGLLFFNGRSKNLRSEKTVSNIFAYDLENQGSWVMLSTVGETPSVSPRHSVWEGGCPPDWDSASVSSTLFSWFTQSQIKKRIRYFWYPRL